MPSTTACDAATCLSQARAIRVSDGTVQIREGLALCAGCHAGDFVVVRVPVGGRDGVGPGVGGVLGGGSTATRVVLMAFFFSGAAAHRDLHSFPTRRSSD